MLLPLQPVRKKSGKIFEDKIGKWEAQGGVQFLATGRFPGGSRVMH